jgi:hypothetical protein
LQKIDPYKNDDDSKPLIICESNSLRNAIKPGLFIMIMNKNGESIKKSAAEVADKADITLLQEFSQHEIDDLITTIKKQF